MKKHGPRQYGQGSGHWRVLLRTPSAPPTCHISASGESAWLLAVPPLALGRDEATEWRRVARYDEMKLSMGSLSGLDGLQQWLHAAGITPWDAQ